MTSTSSSPPLTGTWAIDAMHSSIEFGVAHLAINLVRGRFVSFEGVIDIPDGLSGATATATIDATSVDSHFAMRDEYLRAVDFFDAAGHPEIRFASTAFTPLDDRRFDVSGDLTIRGVSNPVTLHAELLGTVVDQYDKERIGFSANTVIKRSDFGLPYAVEVGGVPVAGDKVTITLDIQAVKQG